MPRENHRNKKQNPRKRRAEQGTEGRRGRWQRELGGREWQPQDEKDQTKEDDPKEHKVLWRAGERKAREAYKLGSMGNDRVVSNRFGRT